LCVCVYRIFLLIPVRFISIVHLFSSIQHRWGLYTHTHRRIYTLDTRRYLYLSVYRHKSWTFIYTGQERESLFSIYPDRCISLSLSLALPRPCLLYLPVYIFIIWYMDVVVL
jgi:hypothetical protein